MQVLERYGFHDHVAKLCYLATQKHEVMTGQPQTERPDADSKPAQILHPRERECDVAAMYFQAAERETERSRSSREQCFASAK